MIALPLAVSPVRVARPPVFLMDGIVVAGPGVVESLVGEQVFRLVGPLEPVGTVLKLQVMPAVVREPAPAEEAGEAGSRLVDVESAGFPIECDRSPGAGPIDGDPRPGAERGGVIPTSRLIGVNRTRPAGPRPPPWPSPSKNPGTSKWRPSGLVNRTCEPVVEKRVQRVVRLVCGGAPRKFKAIGCQTFGVPSTRSRCSCAAEPWPVRILEADKTRNTRRVAEVEELGHEECFPVRAGPSSRPYHVDRFEDPILGMVSHDNVFFSLILLDFEK